MKVWLTKDLEIEEVYNILPQEQTKILKIIANNKQNFYMNDLNLRNENRTNEPITKTQKHLTILKLRMWSANN